MAARRDLLFLEKAARELREATTALQPDPKDPCSRLAEDSTGKVIAFAVFTKAPPEDPTQAFHRLAEATSQAISLARPRPRRRESIRHLIDSAKTPSERLAASIWHLMKVAASHQAIADSDRVRMAADIVADAWMTCTVCT